jgi:hypothetical protein
VLYAGVTPGSLRAQTPTAPFLTAAEERAGYFRNPTNQIAYVFEVAPGGWVWVQVRAWDLRVAETYEACAQLGLGAYGESQVLFVPSGGEFQTPPSVLHGLRSFSLRPITGVRVRASTVENNKLRLEWYGGAKSYQVQQTSALRQTWENVDEPTTALSWTNAITGPQRFFRVIGSRN